MEDSKIMTPQKLTKKAGGTISSSSISKASQLKDSRNNYMPSRFISDRPPNKNLPHELLHNVEELAKQHQTLGASRLRTRPQPQPKILIDLHKNKAAESQEFKTRPMRRYESDYLNFKQIFVQPREEVLRNIRTKEVPEAAKAGTPDRMGNEENQLGSRSPDRQTDLRSYIDAGIQFLDGKTEGPEAESGSTFYDEMIKVQPPDLPNSSVASTLAPGSGYAPSIPLTYMIKEGRTSLRDLLVRAKAGINAEDVQKEAHLSYFLGTVYESRREHDLAAKFYKRFLGFAKTMEDKIGMALGANRVALSEYYRGNIPRSITYNQENLKLSDRDNSFAGLYNLGVCHRKLDRYQESLQFFDGALQWALERDEIEEYCITYGQLGVTYLKMQLYQEALENFEKCLDLSRKIKKTRIELQNLIYISKITSRFNLKSKHNTESLLQSTLKNAGSLQDKKVVALAVCNIGILNGKQAFQLHREQSNFSDDVQQLP